METEVWGTSCNLSLGDSRSVRALEVDIQLGTEAKEIITGTSKVLLNKADVFEAIQETNTQQPGFPPDILHDLLEGVIPVELALCLKGLLNAIEMATQLKLRVILDDENAEKLILPSRPETVNDLIFEVKNKLELTYDIRLQFQDPDFDNALCNLVNMEDLPSKATIKIVRLVEYDLSSTSTDETVMLSDNTDSPDRLSRWPEVFVVPTFSYEKDGLPSLVKPNFIVNSTGSPIRTCHFPSSLDSINIHNSFFNSTKKKRTGIFGEKMANLLRAYAEQDKNDISAARVAALAGLPLYLKEDSSAVFKNCKEEEFEEFHKGPVALVAVVDEDNVPSVIPFQPLSVSVILEDQVVMSHRSWADALVNLFGLLFALHLSYPEKLAGFFEFIQIVILNLDDGRRQLKPKLQALRNELD
ncbi:hypothetical protein SRHO_G00054900 [Serrasalmus rhombeus]